MDEEQRQTKMMTKSWLTYDKGHFLEIYSAYGL